MEKPAIPATEPQRLDALRRYALLDTAPEREYDDLTALAAYICGTPIAYLSLIDAERQWFKAKIGLTQEQTPRDLAFCAHVINQPEQTMVVADALADARFADNPLVTAEPRIRFYAGAPLVTPDGYAVGTLCAVDHEPRQLGQAQLDALQALSRQAVAQMELRLGLARLHAEQEKTESLLLNILPADIAQRLKLHPGTLADRFESVSILFADLVSFTELAACLTPETLLELLTDLFSRFDRLTEVHGLEKIKTIGDAYLAASGLPVQRPDHAQAAAAMALDMLAEVAAFNVARGRELNLRIGIHSGPVVAGVIGTKKFSYDLWGDAVNTASRMESHGLPGHIQISAATRVLLGEAYRYEARGPVLIKGKGEMRTFWLRGRLS